jgi:GNAT superfamily N-acetyltransferase
MDDDIRLEEVDGSDWAVVEVVFSSEASARNCWCQFHVLDNATAARTTRPMRRDLLKEQISNLEPGRGLLAKSGRDPVGWCGVEPRVRLRHVTSSRLVEMCSPYEIDDPAVWAIYCILVPPKLRRGGVGSKLLIAALNHARTHGASAVEAYPIDTSRRGGKLPPGFSTGTLDMFERADFIAMGSLPSGRTLVHLPL